MKIFFISINVVIIRRNISSSAVSEDINVGSNIRSHQALLMAYFPVLWFTQLQVPVEIQETKDVPKVSQASRTAALFLLPILHWHLELLLLWAWPCMVLSLFIPQTGSFYSKDLTVKPKLNSSCVYCNGRLLWENSKEVSLSDFLSSPQVPTAC